MFRQDKFAVYVTSMSYLILKRAATSCPSGEWSDADYDVLAIGHLLPARPDEHQSHRDMAGDYRIS
jgi:hypothetical protein